MREREIQKKREREKRRWHHGCVLKGRPASIGMRECESERERVRERRKREREEEREKM